VLFTYNRGNRDPEYCDSGGRIVGRVVTIEISDAAARRAQKKATESARRVEEVLAEWIDRVAVDPPVETLPNDEILALCRSELAESQQQELSDLLARNREGTLGTAERSRLDERMNLYRHGLVRKAQAIHVAVQRELIPPLT
jgi:hypothetical protein